MTAPQQAAGIPPQIQQQLGMFQQIQQQLQQVSSQKMQYEMTLRETKRALEEIEAAADDSVIYSAIGSVLIQKPKAAVKAELEEKIDSLELRIGSLDKQEKAMTTKASQLQKQIQEAISIGSSIPTAYFFDIWYGSADNLKLIRGRWRHFLTRLTKNCKVNYA